MEKERNILMILFGLFILLNIFLIVFSLTNFNITGKGISGQVVFGILGSRDITIHSPENITYDFNKSNESYYNTFDNLALNVSTNFEIEGWRYILEQTTPRGGKNTVDEEFAFGSPNMGWITSLDIYRWSNYLKLYVWDSNMNEYSEEVSFYVNVSNSAPLINSLSEELFVCENDVLIYYFTSSDIDEDWLTPSIYPSNPFYIGNAIALNHTTTRFRISSRVLNKIYIGGVNSGSKLYPLEVHISDSEYFDSDELNITVVEKNNAPEISPVGVQTVWTSGDDSVFSKQVWVEDIEDGNSNGGNLNFSINFLNSEELFEINESGWMFFEPNLSHLNNGNPQVYDIEVCVEDNGIENPHQNISDVCGQTGESISSCDEFTLTVTAENRPPVIVSYSPLDLELNVSGTDDISFSVETYDPDGTIPDIKWYVEDRLVEVDSGSSSGSFNYNFGCGVSGKKSIIAVTTDGLLNDSIEWEINVGLVSCPSPISSGGGGGGPTCSSDWECNDWGVCQNLERSLKSGFLKGEDYRSVRTECDEKGLGDVFCGFQIRECYDLNECNLFYDVPPQIQSCNFTEDPSCTDEIKNCHSGGCEVGIDCGGPCDACPTCSDGIQNQEEKGIDCGGPCPYLCPVEKKDDPSLMVFYVIISLLIILIVLVIIKIRRVIIYNRLLKKKR